MLNYKQTKLAKLLTCPKNSAKKMQKRGGWVKGCLILFRKLIRITCKDLIQAKFGRSKAAVGR